MIGSLLLLDTLFGAALAAEASTAPKPETPARRIPRPPARAGQLAEAVLARWDGTLPVDVVGLSQACGVDARPQDQDASIGATLGSMEDLSAPVILFNTAMSAAAQRFAIAHALGRVLLGSTPPGPIPRACFFALDGSATERSAKHSKTAILNHVRLSARRTRPFPAPIETGCIGA